MGGLKLIPSSSYAVKRVEGFLEGEENYITYVTKKGGSTTLLEYYSKESYEKLLEELKRTGGYIKSVYHYEPERLEIIRINPKK